MGMEKSVRVVPKFFADQGTVCIVEIDPIIAMQAKMEGFEILSREEAAGTGDMFVTATGCIKTIAKQDIVLMKDGAILMNMCH